MLKMVILRPTLLDNFFYIQHIDMEDTLYLSWRAPAGACISQINLKFLNRLYYLRRGAQGPKIWQFEALKGGNHLKCQPDAPQASGKDNKRPVAIARGSFQSWFFKMLHISTYFTWNVTCGGSLQKCVKRFRAQLQRLDLFCWNTNPWSPRNNS